MAIFHGKLLVYQRVAIYLPIKHDGMHKWIEWVPFDATFAEVSEASALAASVEKAR